MAFLQSPHAMALRMITCCPACSTLFRVGADQLQVADGWVRCGQCMVAFDARTRMVPADPYAPLPDPDWYGDGQEPGAVPPPGPTGNAANAELRRAADSAAGMAEADSGTAASAPQRASPAAEVPAFAAPPFELAPPPSPPEPVAVPVFAPKPLARAADPAPAAAQPRAQAAILPPPLPIPASDELDRRYARLLDTLTRLRATSEKGDGELDDAETSPSSYARGGRGSGPAARRGGRSGPRNPPAQRRPVERQVEHDARRRADASPERGAAPQRRRKRESEPLDPDRRAGRDAPPAQRRDEEEQQSRPMIDFVLSEIGGLLPLPVFAPSQSEPELKAKPSEPEVPSFVEQAQRRAVWGLPDVRAVLWGTAAALALMLAAQIAVSQRDRLAAEYPGVTPLLQALCRPMRCQIAPWRYLDAVAMEDSPIFVPTGANSFRFAVTLRNNGNAPVAMPALELALLDAQNQPLARRVLNPADWGAPQQLAAYGEFNGAASLTVLGAVNARAASSYRIEFFYP
jgi:predicted Zn finger-like uncharacterized protein